MNRHQYLTLVAALILLTGPAFGFTGKAVRVIDGDTLVVLVDGKREVRVRLANIDAPELGQPFGQKAKDALVTLVAGKEVEISDRGKDRYGRTIGVVRVDETSAGSILVYWGLAWVYRKYNENENLLVLEGDAMVNRRGLWADKNPVPPWEWRRKKPK